MSCPFSLYCLFQSTPPARGATAPDAFDTIIVDISIHAPREGGDRPPSRGRPAAPPISIHAPREGGDRGPTVPAGRLPISIHAPREGGDLGRYTTLTPQRNFNPRPPRGGRQLEIVYSSTTTIFQSTPPARGATYMKPMESFITSNFNPRPPRGGRHTPEQRAAADDRFQSTPPARGATADQFLRAVCIRISIHAPREGGDVPR